LTHVATTKENLMVQNMIQIVYRSSFLVALTVVLGRQLTLRQYRRGPRKDTYLR